MKPTRHIRSVWLILFGLPAAACLLAGRPAPAQEAGNDTGSIAGQADQNNPPPADAAALPADPNADQSGPVRLARFTFVSDKVMWRTDSSSEWTAAALNVPLRQGAEISIPGAGRAELQFDDGSLVRFGNGAVATLKTLYSDQDGEFTEIDQTAGLSTLKLVQESAVFQVNTPLVSIKANGPARLRIGVDDGVEIADHQGAATIEGTAGKVVMQEGDYLDLATATSPYTLRALPGADSWEQWNDQRDGLVVQQQNSQTEQHLPTDVAIAAGNLDTYGTWDEDPTYGWVWSPHVTDPVWRPYYAGHWTWVNPFGWTWVADEPWGWAPYHYGAWVHARRGWAWVPGPASQYWCPAVVSFSESNGVICWAPLCPEEVRYPAAFAIGFRHGNWFDHFSIGRAGCYYPASYGVFTASVWGNSYVNRVTFNVNLAVGGRAFAPNRNTYVSGRVYVPINARVAAGATFSQAAQFGGAGRYEPVRNGDTGYFTNGHAIGPPAAGSRPVAGPIVVQPTARATSPNRTFATGGVPAAAVHHSVYRAPVPTAVARGSVRVNSAGQPIERPVVSSRGPAGATPNPSRGGTERTALGGASDTQRSAAAKAAQDARESLGLHSHTGTEGDRNNAPGGNGNRNGGDNYHPATSGGNSAAPGTGRTGQDTRPSNPGTGRTGGSPGSGQNRPARSSEPFHVRESGGGAPKSGGGGGSHGGGGAAPKSDGGGGKDSGGKGKG